METWRSVLALGLAAPCSSRIVESQNHKMLRIGKDLERSSSPTPLP